MKLALTALAAAAAGAALVGIATSKTPLWDWWLAWLGAASLWTAALLAALAIPTPWRQRLSPAAARALAIAHLLLLNPATAGLALGAAAWHQRAALDDALDRSDLTTHATVTRIHQKQTPSGGAQALMYVVAYEWEADGRRWAGEAAFSPAEASALREGASLGALRLLPGRPGLHRLRDERLVDGTLRGFTWAMGILSAICLLLLGYVLTTNPEPGETS